MDILDNIKLATDLLDKIEDYINSLEAALIEVNQKQQDLLHLIENENLKTNECYRVIKELHKVRVKRREIKNDIELANTFKLHKKQLLNIENRKFLIDILNKKQEQLLNSKYKNRNYTQEELKQLVKMKQ